MNHKAFAALALLKKYVPAADFSLLGTGKSSVVFHDGKLVYKVFMLKESPTLAPKRPLRNTLVGIKDKFIGAEHFYPIQDLQTIDEQSFVLTYPYEAGSPCVAFDREEIQHFLRECWQRKLIFLDIKPANFIRVNGALKWIDYEPEVFSDNLFLNMAVRAFIYVRYAHESKAFLAKLCRSAINQFSLPELAGVHHFLNQLFTKIIFQESKTAIKAPPIPAPNLLESIADLQGAGNYHLPYSDSFHPEQVFWNLLSKGYYLEDLAIENPTIDANNYFSPEKIRLQVKRLKAPRQAVSLIIKACVQDATVVFASVKHIVKQLATPHLLEQKILALDIRQTDFLREYDAHNSWEKLLEESQRLLALGVVDEVLFPSEEEIAAVNQKWFAISTRQSHTWNKIPVTAQLYAFEKSRNNFVLQVDCDAMIGRLDREHAFLDDMMEVLEKEEKVLSVGFNIYQGKASKFTAYFGFEHGGFVPEVRFCLFRKDRIESLLPLPNELLAEGFKWSWYRSLEQQQKLTGYCSVRGGDSRSFFIHPQNFKKKDRDTWFTTLDRVEQLQIPDQQMGKFDLEGSYYDWTLNKRNEDLVILSCFRNIPLSRFLRFWYSLLSQTHSDWGLILIDDASDNGIAHYIEALIKSHRDRITFVKNRFRVGVAQNTYKAIHYFMENHQSIVCNLDADDALMGKNVLRELYEKYRYWGADLVIGKMYRTDKLAAHYPYPPNFTQPRLYGGNVWQHLRSFRKYLFDSLDYYDLKIKNAEPLTEDHLLSRKFSVQYVFPEYCSDYTHMIPMVELSTNPMWIDHFNVFHDRTTINSPEIKAVKERIIAEVLAKPAKQSGAISEGRKTFLPNLKKIEIDITYECNLKCINCNRSSTQAPTKEGMTLEQIQQFISESISLDKEWELINLLGGEPTIHPDFAAIVHAILYQYIIPFSPHSILQITSNGHGELVEERLAQLPHHPNLIIDYASFKKDRVISYFSPFNEAPIDDPQADHSEYHKGCWVTAYCGIGLNQLGYYPCGVAGGIDRVMQLGLGVESLKDVDESIGKQLKDFCQYCGNFKDYAQNRGDFIPRQEKAALVKPSVSKTWKKAYRTYNGK